MSYDISVQSSVEPSLIPRLSHGEGEPGTHCLRMRPSNERHERVLNDVMENTRQSLHS